MRLREIRTAKGLSQYRLAKNTGVPQSYLSKLEKGQRKSCGYEIARKLAIALDVPIEELMDDSRIRTTDGIRVSS